MNSGDSFDLDQALCRALKYLPMPSDLYLARIAAGIVQPVLPNTMSEELNGLLKADHW